MRMTSDPAARSTEMQGSASGESARDPALEDSRGYLVQISGSRMTAGDRLDEAARAFAALGHGTRMRVCTMLLGASRPLSAGDVAKALDVPPNLLTHHVSQLVRAGCIEARRSGRFVLLGPNRDRLANLAEMLSVRPTAVFRNADEADGA